MWSVVQWSNATVARSITAKTAGQWKNAESSPINVGNSTAENATTKYDILQEILLFIDAGAYLKKLKLAGCINITGAGLSPLRGSVVLQQIDLSLIAEHKSPVLDSEPHISCEQVSPILDSIIAAADGHVLKCVRFPNSWDMQSSAIEGFQERYARRYNSLGLRCTKCNYAMRQFGEYMSYAGYLDYVAGKICYDCLKPFCIKCRYSSMTSLLECCNGCKKSYCNNCTDMKECSGQTCGSNKCEVCIKKYPNTKCTECEEFYCDNCLTTSKNNCNTALCQDCTPLRYLLGV